ncbi:tRNA-specific adenosine deaminase 2-like [Ostrea edulis]|uniref:tRNA-specific adenosine deaminase 2-like n=1 Tax=Ostrea edulis TaxID=37623 RepID=UPI002094B370|nr:tRNA-specific adenosine deaminase 2-like [Ostrea edulis]
MDDAQQNWMVKSFNFAEEALEAGEVPVGCIMVYNDEIIAVGRNEVNETKNATRHAEIVAIDQVLKWSKAHEIHSADVFHKTVLYVTVEPCIMCAGALRQVGIPLVIFGCYNDRFGGCGSILSVHDANITSLGPSFQSVGGIMKDRAVELLKKFYQGENPNAPEEKRKSKKEESN